MLSYYGGIWIDEGTILVENLSWIMYNNLKYNIDVINQGGN